LGIFALPILPNDFFDLASGMTWTALPITSAGRFSPLGPVGIFFNHRFEFNNSASEITMAIFPNARYCGGEVLSLGAK